MEARRGENAARCRRHEPRGRGGRTEGRRGEARTWPKPSQVKFSLFATAAMASGSPRAAARDDGARAVRVTERAEESVDSPDEPEGRIPQSQRQRPFSFS